MKFNYTRGLIKEFDEKLKKFEGEYNKVSNYYSEALDEYKDLLIESNEYEDALLLNQKMEKEISLTHKAFEFFLDHACKAISAAQGGDRTNQIACYAAARARLINLYIYEMKDMIFSQGWFYGSEFEQEYPRDKDNKLDQISSSSEACENKYKSIEKEESNLKKEDKKKTSKFISFFKKLFRKIAVIF